MTAVVQMSGGKDSTALLYLLRDRLHDMTVLFGDAGATFAHVRAHVEETCQRLGARLLIVRPPVPVAEYTAAHGLPADIVPVEADAAFAPFLAEAPKTLLQPYTRCCSAMLWEPMQAAIRQMGAKVVYRGSKRADARVGAPDGFVEDGIKFLSPLWEWSDSDVMDFLDREGVTLPAHYAEVGDSLDCHSCSAHLGHHGAAKLRWMREHTPHLYEPAAERIRKVRETLLEHAGRIGEAMKEAS